MRVMLNYEFTGGSSPLFFASANGAGGFRSYFNEIFPFASLEHTIILKGGPGTGKSRLLNDAQKLAAEKGYKTECFLCSSDPFSLDGILIKPAVGRPIAIIDGTAPHVAEPKIPGASEEIFNLGDFWDRKKLASRRGEIEELNEIKSSSYLNAYRLLSAAGETLSVHDTLLSEALDGQKLAGAVTRMLSKRKKKLPGTCPPVREPRLEAAITMNGPYNTNTYKNLAENSLCVSDKRGGAHLFIGEAIRQAKEFGLSYYYSPSPLLKDRIEAVFFPQLSLSLYTGLYAADDTTIINTDRFLDGDIVSNLRTQLKGLALQTGECVHAAVTELEKARKNHFILEDIYLKAMDFKAKEEASAQLIKGLLDY